MRKFKVMVLSALLAVSAPAFADNDDVSFGDVLNTINNVFGASNSNIQAAIGVSKDVVATNTTECNASGGSACQGAAATAVTQNAGQGQENIQLAVGWIDNGVFENRTGGSADGGSVIQGAAGAAATQNATGLR